MFCSNCGKEIADTTRFCPYCGYQHAGAAPSTQASVVAAPDSQPVQATPAKKRSKKWLWGVFAAAAVVIIAVVCVGFLFSDSEITFQDPLVERCVRLTLDKGADEPITKKECAAIEELLIDCDLDISGTLNLVTASWDAANYIDLCDLQYLTGLKELVIDNHVSRDMLVNLDAMSHCRKLEKLTMQYNPSENYHDGALPMGYKYLAEIIAQLPELEELDLGYMVAEEHQQLLMGDNTKLEIVNDSDPFMVLQNTSTFYPADMNSYLNGWSYAYNEDSTHSRTLHVRIGDQDELEEFLDTLPRKTEDICIYYSGESLDLEPVSDFKHLKTLTIVCPFRVYSYGDTRLKNLDALAANKDLFSLNLCGVNGDFEEIGSLTQLKELSLSFCLFEDTDFLKSLTNLRELSFTINDYCDLLDYIKDNGDRHEALSFLRIYTLNDTMTYKGLAALPNLETLSLYSDISTMKYIAQCSKLKHFSFETAGKDRLDLSDLTQLDALEYLYINQMNRPEPLEGVEEILALPNMTSLTLPTVAFTEENEYKVMNSWIDAAVKNASVSYLMMNRRLFHDMTLNGQDIHEMLDINKLYDAQIICGGYDLSLIKLPGKYSTIDDVFQAHKTEE